MPAPATRGRKPVQGKETEQTARNSSVNSGEGSSANISDVGDPISHSESKPAKRENLEPAKKLPLKKAPVKDKKVAAGKKAKGGKKRKAVSDSDEDDAHEDYLESRKNVAKKTNLKSVDARGKVTEITAAAFPSGGIRLGLSRSSRPGNSLHPRARGS